MPEINRMLNYLFTNYGPAWLVDNGDMTQTYFFDFSIPAGMQLIFENFDVLLPSGFFVHNDNLQGNYKRQGLRPVPCEFQ